MNPIDVTGGPGTGEQKAFFVFTGANKQTIKTTGMRMASRQFFDFL